MLEQERLVTVVDVEEIAKLAIGVQLSVAVGWKSIAFWMPWASEHSNVASALPGI